MPVRLSQVRARQSAARRRVSLRRRAHAPRLRPCHQAPLSADARSRPRIGRARPSATGSGRPARSRRRPTAAVSSSAARTTTVVESCDHVSDESSTRIGVATSVMFQGSGVGVMTAAKTNTARQPPRHQPISCARRQDPHRVQPDRQNSGTRKRVPNANIRRSRNQ